jgi:hypothetical protein
MGAIGAFREAEMAKGAGEIIGQGEYLRWSVARLVTPVWLVITQAVALWLAGQVIVETIGQATGREGAATIMTLCFVLLWAVAFAYAAWKSCLGQEYLLAAGLTLVPLLMLASVFNLQGLVTVNEP